MAKPPYRYDYRRNRCQPARVTNRLHGSAQCRSRADAVSPRARLGDWDAVRSSSILPANNPPARAVLTDVLLLKGRLLAVAFSCSRAFRVSPPQDATASPAASQCEIVLA